MRGKEPDISYTPNGLAKTMSEVPPTGPDAQYELTTDPSIHYCEPLGLGRIYMYPAKVKFIQTPEAVVTLRDRDAGASGSPIPASCDFNGCARCATTSTTTK